MAQRAAASARSGRPVAAPTVPVAEQSCAELMRHEDTSMHGWAQVWGGGGGSTTSPGPSLSLSSAVAPSKSKPSGKLPKSRKSTKAASPSRAAAWQLRFCVLVESTLFMFPSLSHAGPADRRYNCMKKSVRQIAMPSGGPKQSHRFVVELQHLEDGAGGKRSTSAPAAGSRSISMPASRSPRLLLAVDSPALAERWVSKLYFASIGLTGPGGAAAGAAFAASGTARVMAYNNSGAAAATAAAAAAAAAAVAGGGGGGGGGGAAAAAAATAGRGALGVRQVSRRGLGGPVRSTEGVRSRQLQHLQLATGILAKYDALNGPAPTPEQYAAMLSELLHCVNISSSPAASPVIMTASPTTGTTFSNETAAQTIAASSRLGSSSGGGNATGATVRGRGGGGSGSQRCGGGDGDRGGDEEERWHDARTRWDVQPPPGRPLLERAPSRATRVLRSAGLDGFRGMLRERRHVHSVEDLLNLQMTDAVQAELGMTDEEQQKFVHLQQQLADNFDEVLAPTPPPRRVRRPSQRRFRHNKLTAGAGSVAGFGDETMGTDDDDNDNDDKGLHDRGRDHAGGVRVSREGKGGSGAAAAAAGAGTARTSTSSTVEPRGAGSAPIAAAGADDDADDDDDGGGADGGGDDGGESSTTASDEEDEEAGGVRADILSLNDVFFPRVDVATLIRPLRTFKVRAFERKLVKAALPHKIRHKLAGAFGITASSSGGGGSSAAVVAGGGAPGRAASGSGVGGGGWHGQRVIRRHSDLAGSRRHLLSAGAGRLSAVPVAVATTASAGSGGGGGGEARRRGGSGAGSRELLGLPNVKTVTSWLRNLCTVVSTFNKYLRAFGRAERKGARQRRAVQRQHRRHRAGSAAADDDDDSDGAGTGGVVGGDSSDSKSTSDNSNDSDSDAAAAGSSSATPSFLHLAHLINILKGLLLAPPKLLVVQDSSRASDKYKSQMDLLQLYLCKLSPTVTQYHKLLTLFSYVQTYYNLEVDNDDIEKRLGTLRTIRAQARHVLARFKWFWVDDEGEGAATRGDIKPLVLDILQKAVNITHLLHRTKKLEASFPTEALIDMVEGGKHGRQQSQAQQQQQPSQQPPPPPPQQHGMSSAPTGSASVGSGGDGDAAAGPDDDAHVDPDGAATAVAAAAAVVPARGLQGLYNLEACGFPLHIPPQFLAKHWAFWKAHFRDRLTFPRYMCFNRFLTKEHLRDLILHNPAKWEELHTFSRALANGIPAFKMVRYLETEEERAAYRVSFRGGKMYDARGALLDTADMASGKAHFKASGRNEVGRGWAIAVLHRAHGLFVGSHARDAFHHSSFLAAVEMGVHFAGEVKVEEGVIVAVTNNSGHYKPGEVHIRSLLQWLSEDGKVPQTVVDAIDVTNVCDKLYYPDQHKEEFLNEIRETIRQAVCTLYIAEDADEGGGDGAEPLDAVGEAAPEAATTATGGQGEVAVTGVAVANDAANAAADADRRRRSRARKEEARREAAAVAEREAAARVPAHSFLKSATFPGPKFRRTGGSGGDVGSGAGDSVAVIVRGGGGDGTGGGGAAAAAGAATGVEGTAVWKEAVAAALRLQGLLLSEEQTAELRTFVGVKMQFRHLSSPPWAQWFARELKAIVLKQLRRLHKLSARRL